MEELPQPQPTDKFVKALFYNLRLAYGYDDQNLRKLAYMAKVGKSVVDAMFVSFGVRRAEAEKVLVAFSEYTKQTWNLDNVRVALMPTFADLREKHQLDLARLVSGAGVPYTVIDMMLEGHAVSLQDALLVLQMTSRLTRGHYTLENVDVPIEEEEQHE